MTMDVERTEVYREEKEAQWFGDVQFPREELTISVNSCGNVELMLREWYREQDHRRVFRDWDELAPEITQIVLGKEAQTALKQVLH